MSGRIFIVLEWIGYPLLIFTETETGNVLSWYNQNSYQP